MTDMAGKSFVREHSTQARPAPVAAGGALLWTKENLFKTPMSGLLTLVSIAFLAWIIPDIVRYLFIDAVWSAPDGKACREPGTGACWAYVRAKMTSFTYGSYPRTELWRVDLTLIAGAILVVWLLWPGARWRGIGSALFFFVYPIISFGLLTGSAPFPVGWLPSGGFWFVVFVAVQLLAVAGAVYLIMRGEGLTGGVILAMLGWMYVGLAWPMLGLRHVGTDLWGGIFVSLLVASVGIVFSLPLGILLALGRRSKMVVVKFFSIVVIEFVRGVPLITVLFMANTMLPLFVPQEWSPDRLLRPLLGVALFASVYMAEVVRGGLQAMPKGQFEGAMALGLGWWQMMRLIILPQALVMVIPGIVNSFIALFKDTTLVAIVGIFDFLKVVDTQRLDPVWSGPTISTTGYVFAAIFYFLFCFGMSRYSMMMERRLSAGRRRD